MIAGLVCAAFCTAIFEDAHEIHSSVHFELEPFIRLQYRFAQSGTSDLFTAFVALRDRCGREAPGCALAAPAWMPLRTKGELYRRPSHPRRVEPLQSASWVLRALCAGNPRRLCRAGDSPACTATSALRISRSSLGWLAAPGRRKRGPRPPTLEPCLLERSAGGWPADRPSVHACWVPPSPHPTKSLDSGSYGNLRAKY